MEVLLVVQSNFGSLLVALVSFKVKAVCCCGCCQFCFAVLLFCLNFAQMVELLEIGRYAVVGSWSDM